MERLRFHLDEHVNPAIAKALRQHGIDVTTTVEKDLNSASDVRQLEFALSENRVLVTHDHDFLRLHQQQEVFRHSGIAYCHQRRSIGQITRRLVQIWTIATPDEMENMVEFL